MWKFINLTLVKWEIYFFIRQWTYPQKILS